MISSSCMIMLCIVEMTILAGSVPPCMDGMVVVVLGCLGTAGARGVRGTAGA